MNQARLARPLSMALLYEGRYFLVETPDQPLIDREDGGHITIVPKKRVPTIQDLEPPQAIELIRLMMVVGEAMTTALKKNGVDIGRINYQDNGNWGVFKPEGPYQHVHMYGRAKGATVQKFGQALHFPHRDEHPEFYEAVKGLTASDILEIKAQIRILFSMAKYSDSTWNPDQA